MKSSPFAQELRKRQTSAEKYLWLKLRDRQIFQVKFRRQHVIVPYIVDFIALDNKLIIELDGGDHNKEENKRHDKRRTEFLENKGYLVLRFWNNDILKNIDGVLDVISYNLRKPSSQPSPYK